MNRYALVVGLAFGFLIAAARLSDYDVIHRMLLVQELDVFLLMASAVGTAAPLLFLLQRRGWRAMNGQPMVLRRAPVQRRNILGAIAFGSGWAIVGTCPGPAIAMAAGGNVLGVVVMVGLVAGVFLYEKAAILRAEIFQDPLPRSRSRLPS